MGLEGVQGPLGSQVFWLILLKPWCIKSESKGPITFLNMVINPKGDIAYNANFPPPFNWYKLNHFLLLFATKKMSIQCQVWCHAVSCYMMWSYFFSMLSVLSKASLFIFTSGLLALLPPSMQVVYLVWHMAFCNRLQSQVGSIHIPEYQSTSLCHLPWPNPNTSPSCVDIQLSCNYVLSQGKKGSSGFLGLNGLPGIKVMLLGNKNPGLGRRKMKEDEELPKMLFSPFRLL